MSTTSRSELKRLFAEAIELPAGERGAILARLDALGTPLAAELRSLLAAHDAAGDFLERAVAAEVEEVVGDPPNADLAGRRVGPYQLVRRLGRGGMGEVYLAERSGDFAQQVAVKLLRSGPLSEDLVRRFRAERQTLASLQHPNIARLYDGGTTTEGWPYLVMEYVDGEPIDAYCARRDLAIAERLRLFLDVCAAVDHAHRNLVVHRDLKPANILVTEAGEVKLLDFGIAKLLHGALREETVAMTRADQVMLTWKFASPEQIRGEVITTATDVYGLGFLFCRLLADGDPYDFPSESPATVARVICEEPPLPPSRVAARREEEAARAAGSRRRRGRKLPGDLDDIALKALGKDPERRYRSVEQLAEDVRRHLAGRPVSARGAHIGYRTRKFVRRHHSAVIAAALLGLALLAGVASTLWQARRAERQAARAEAERAAAEQVTSFLADTLASADASWNSHGVASRAEVTVAEVLDAAAERLAAPGAAPAPVRRRLLLTLGNSYRSLGLLAAAREQLRRALALERGVAAPSAERAQIVHSLGIVRYFDGAYGQALVLMRASLAEETQLPAAEQIDLGPFLNDLGAALWKGGRLDEAEPFLERAIEVERTRFGDAYPAVAIGLGNLGILRDSRGDAAGAEALYRRALDTFGRIPGRELPEKAFSLLNLGGLRRLQGRYDEAAALLGQALALWRRTLGADHPTTALAEVAHGQLAHDRGDDRSALAHAEAALRVLRETVGPGHPDVARAEAVRGAALCGLGRSAEGIATLEAARQHRRGSYPPSDPRTDVEAGLAACYAASHQPDKARALLVQSYRALVEALGEDHPATIRAGRRLAALTASGAGVSGRR